MSDAPKPLDLDNARAALARARNDITPAAVRAPRPADLSRLQEMEARTATIDARATAFRETVRQSLGLGAYHGPNTAPSRLAAHAMSTPLCDADVCAPVRPAAATPAPAQAAITDAPDLAQAEPAAPAPAPAETLTGAPMEAEGPGAAAGPGSPIRAQSPVQVTWPARPGVRPGAKNFWEFSRRQAPSILRPSQAAGRRGRAQDEPGSGHLYRHPVQNHPCSRPGRPGSRPERPDKQAGGMPVSGNGSLMRPRFARSRFSPRSGGERSFVGFAPFDRLDLGGQRVFEHLVHGFHRDDEET